MARASALIGRDRELRALTDLIDKVHHEGAATVVLRPRSFALRV